MFKICRFLSRPVPKRRLSLLFAPRHALALSQGAMEGPTTGPSLAGPAGPAGGYWFRAASVSSTRGRPLPSVQWAQLDLRTEISDREQRRVLLLSLARGASQKERLRLRKSSTTRAEKQKVASPQTSVCQHGFWNLKLVAVACWRRKKHAC